MVCGAFRSCRLYSRSTTQHSEKWRETLCSSQEVREELTEEDAAEVEEVVANMDATWHG